MTMSRDVLCPLKLAILFSCLGEALIFIIWGIFLYPEGNILHKFLWTVVFCGFGMGSAIGALISIFVVGRLQGNWAVLVCTAISTVLLGFFCNFLCLNLDMHFGYFGGAETPQLFILNGIVLSAVGGWLIGWLCFTDNGKEIINMIN